MKDFALRFWDTTDKRWITDAFVDKDGRVGYFTGHSVDWPKDVIASRFTGAHDKAGTDIYEGDIINYQGRRGTIEFFACMFIVDWGDQTDNELSYLGISDIEVTGNIFEYKK